LKKSRLFSRNIIGQKRRNDMVKVLNEKKLSARILYPARLVLEMEEKYFSGQVKTEETLHH
jgi:hypothetical protein